MQRHTIFLAIILGAMLGITGCNREQSEWEKARADNSTDAYESFVKKYPNGAFTGQAQARLKEQYEERDWQKARDVDTTEAYQGFLQQYPEGKWSQEARIRVENFALAQTTPGGPASTDESPPVPAAPGASAPGTGASAPRAAATPPAVAPARAAASKPAKTTPSAPARGGEVVQLGAFKTGRAAADHRWAQLKSKYPQVLKGLEPVVRAAHTPHGTVYRLQVASLAPVAARKLCKSLTAHAEACVIVPKARQK